MADKTCPDCGDVLLVTKQRRVFHSDNVLHSSSMEPYYCLRRQLAAANVIIARLPKTNDGVPILAGTYVWVRWGKNRIPTELEARFIGAKSVVLYLSEANAGGYVPSDCYSTREAAEAAVLGEKEKT